MSISLEVHPVSPWRVTLAGFCASLVGILQTLAAAIMPEDPDNFMDFIRDATMAERYQLSHQFQPDRKTFDRLKRIQGRIGKTITLSFSVEDVQQSRVAYDPTTNVILLHDPTPELIQGIEDNALAP